MELSVIIVSYQVRFFLEQCLWSLRHALNGLSAEVLVVDNQSSDNTVDMLQPVFPEVMFIKSPANLGFAKACNLGLARSCGNCVLFLNPDTLVTATAIQKSLSLFREKPRTGALGIRMLDGSGHFLPESRRGFPTPVASLFKMSGLAACFPKSRLFAGYYMGHLSPRETAEVEVLAGAYFMVRREVLETAGSFDERFFMYGEDIDLSYRVVQAGWKNMYLADASIVHFKGESTGKGSLTYVQAFYQAMRLFVAKHYTGPLGWIYRQCLLGAISIRAAAAAIYRLLPVARLSSGKPDFIPDRIMGVSSNPPLYSQQLRSWEFPGWERAQHINWNDAGVSEIPGKTVWLFVWNSSEELEQAFRLMERYRNRGRYYFYHPGAASIIGSSDKNSNGDIWEISRN